MKISKSEQVGLCSLLADKMVWEWLGYEIVTDIDGNAFYDSDTQDRFNDFYGIIWETLENAKDN